MEIEMEARLTSVELQQRHHSEMLAEFKRDNLDFRREVKEGFARIESRFDGLQNKFEGLQKDFHSIDRQVFGLKTGITVGFTFLSLLIAASAAFVKFYN